MHFKIHISAWNQCRIVFNALEDQKIRKLLAIMFASIIAYRALMQENEGSAVKISSRQREIFEEQHRWHQGDIIQHHGDGTPSILKCRAAGILQSI